MTTPSEDKKLQNLTRTGIRFNLEIIDLAGIVTILETLGYDCTLNSHNSVCKTALESLVQSKILDGTIPDRTYTQAREYLDTFLDSKSLTPLSTPELQSKPRQVDKGNPAFAVEIAKDMLAVAENPQDSDSPLFQGGSLDSVPDISEDEISSNKSKSLKQDNKDDRN